MPEEQQTPVTSTQAAPASMASAASLRSRARKSEEPRDPCIRAENEDDDGYDPYSDRRPEREPLFSEDPWR